MQRHGSIRWPLGITLAAVTLSQSVQAKETAPIIAAKTTSSSVTTNTTGDGDYGYRFSDDPLEAGVFTPTDPRLVVAGRVVRTQLIRPRTMFVVEMLRSVENL